MNYLQSYILNQEKIEKKAEKLVYIQTTSPEKVLAFLHKSFPEATSLPIA
ncbi:MAG: hypothetical protein LBP53_03520 [Candidatus Peribacteria bacterium]|nr:hypothetical protein [Candidatus Peribacteria bacterium]